MSNTTSAPPTPEKQVRGGLALPQATALIVGSIIGVGIFNLPGALASYGPISLVAMALTTVGAVALALLFAALSRRLPADGGPYAYARVAFGNPTGFANAWSYWITAWAGNAAIVTGWVLYVQYVLKDFWPDADTNTWAIIFCLFGLWVPALINLSGVKNMGTVQLWTSILKFIPLAIMSTVGLFFISTDNFHPFNQTDPGQSNAQAILGAMAICLFSYLGVETAAVAAAKVNNPDRNVPRATVLGTLASAAVYLLSLIAVFGILPSAALGESKAPYSDAFNAMIGNGSTWAGTAVAIAVIISGFGALNGWTMICAEMPLAAADDGLFPARFAKLSEKGVPAFGIISATALASVAMWISYQGSGGYNVFLTLLYMTGITAAIPYAFSALAQIKWRIVDQRAIKTPRFIRDLVVAMVSLVFSILFIVYSRNTGGENEFWVWAPFIMAGGAMLLGIPVYMYQRTRMTEPEPVPAFRA